MRGLSRRRQGQQPGPGGAPLRTRSKGEAARARRARRSAAARDRVLELQPLRRRGGHGPQGRAPERSRRGRAARLMGGVRPVVHRRDARLRAGAGLREGRRAAVRRTRTRHAPAWRGSRPRVVRARGPRADRSGTGGRRVPEDLRGSGPRGRLLELAGAGRGRTRARGRGRGRADMGPAGNAAAPVHQALAVDVDAVPVARAAAADVVLRAAPRRARRNPVEPERPDRRAALESARDEHPEPRHGRLLPRPHGHLRPAAHGADRRLRAGQSPGAARGLAPARRRQPPGRLRHGGPAGHRHGRAAEHRDGQGYGCGVRLLRPLGGPAGQGRERAPGARRPHPGPDGGPDAAGVAHHGGDPGVRRLARDGGQPHVRHARGLPVTGHRVQRTDREPRRARRDAPGDGGKPRQRRRRAALPASSPSGRDIEARCRRGSAARSSFAG